MPGVPVVLPVLQWFDDNGDPLASGKVYVYQPGTLVARDTYADQGLTTPNTNPIILDAGGRATVYLRSELSYKFVVKTSADVTLRTEDNVPGSVQVVLPIASNGVEWTGRLNAPSYAYHGLGITATDSRGLYIGGVVSPAAGGTAYGLQVVNDVRPGLNASGVGLGLSPTLQKQGSGTHPIFATAYLQAPVITGSGGTVSEASTLYVEAAPSGATTNYALRVGAGAVNLVGLLVSSAGVVSFPVQAVFSHNSKSKNTVYQADADCLVIVRLLENTTTSVIVRILSDASNPPTTIRAGAQIGTGAGYSREATIIAAVKNGDYYKIEESSLSGTAPTYTIDVVPFGTSANGEV